MKYLSWLLVLVLAALVLHLSRQNRRLVATVTAVTAVSASSASACILPPITALTATNQSFVLEFPRSRPVMILVSDRNCPYCDAAIDQWKGLLKLYPRVEGLLYDRARSYGLPELNRQGVELRNVLVSLPLVTPYTELLSGTPTFMLVGRKGRVLGVWKGRLSAQTIETIKLTVEALLV